ncbi:MAG: hypothetical protein FJ265_18200 [Planctomycetes bacterium]|nr:hypothetical protein [Planctomycetota bacterium]
MLRPPALLCCLCLAACGGGGGGGSAVAVPMRLAASPLDLGPATTAADLEVALADRGSAAPVLLEVAVELPAALAFATEPLVALQPAPTLDGGTVAGRYVVVCGDARNKAAQPLQQGPLFRLRLVTASPRQPGTHRITLRNLRAAQQDGSPAPVEATPTAVDVVVR